MKSKLIAFIFILLLMTTVSCNNEAVAPSYDGIVVKLPDWFSNRMSTTTLESHQTELH